MKKPTVIALGMLILVQFAVPYSMIRNRENVLRNGELFQFKTHPIDPADPFQGRYVWLGYESNHIPVAEEQKPDLPENAVIYARLETDDEGFARFTGWSSEEPTEGYYLKTRYRGPLQQWNRKTSTSTYKGMRIDIPFDHFYMDEAKAPRAERLAQEATRNSNCWANVRILNGKAVIEDVFAAGRSLRDLAAEKE